MICLDDFIREVDVRIALHKKTGFFVAYHDGTQATFIRQSLALERPDLAVNWALIGSLEGT